MISFQEAKEKILTEAAPMGTEERELKSALGKVLAEPVVAVSTLPPFDNSAMDGYAVRSADLAGAAPESPARLRITGESAAGGAAPGSVQPGEAVQIMTGAAMPPGADTVVILEEAKRRDGFVWVDHPVAPGKHIRRKGEDLREGEPALAAGKKIRPAEIALLAALGKERVKVFRTPAAAVLATGSELAGVGEELKAGAIRDSNSWALEGFLASLGVPVLNLGIVPDDYGSIVEAFRKASGCDLILSSGGVSVGEHDLVKRALIKEFDFRTIFWRVRMKPGKPMLFGRLSGKLFFGLPGNPISCAVCFVSLIAPAVRKIMGEAAPGPVTRRAVLAGPVSLKEADKTGFITARMEEGEDPPRVAPTPHQGSGMLSSMTEGNAFIVVPEGVKELPAGAFVEVIPDA